MINQYKVNNSVALSVGHVLCAHLLCVSPSLLVSPDALPQPLETSYPLSVSVDLPALDRPHPRSHAGCDLWRWASVAGFDGVVASPWWRA